MLSTQQRGRLLTLLEHRPLSEGLIDDDIFASLSHFPKVTELLYAHRAEIVGQHVGVRLDIPSVNAGRIVYTIHESPRGGTVLGYDHSVVVDNARFIVDASGQRAIGAKGSAKFPMAFVGGVLSDDPALPVGIPVYYDPRVVHLWVDARTLEPLVGAARVNLIPKRGGSYALPHIDTIYTWAEGPRYYPPGTAPQPPEGMNSAVRME